MDIQQHPITPPPELVRQWLDEWIDSDESGVFMEKLAAQAARWGADQELDACCEYIAGPGRWFVTPQSRLAELRAARRPKPPSLAELALKELERTVVLLMPVTGHKKIKRFDTIRAALKRLQELEKGNE